jgi:shikimate kinase
VVKSTSENALPNSKQKKSDRWPKKRSGKKVGAGPGAQVRSRAATPSPAQAVFLVGFMGAGKSSVGRALGQLLHWTFEDLDDRIERREGRTVRDIFQQAGEKAFRQAEHNALRDLLDELHSGGVRIVALGGGSFVQQRNARLLGKANVATVFLDASVEELWRRCFRQASESGNERPLLRSQGEFRKLYSGRRAAYLKAALRVPTGDRSVEEIAAEIARKLRLSKVAIRTEQGEAE